MNPYDERRFTCYDDIAAEPDAITEPTSEQCSTNTALTIDGNRAVALWTPQLNGYVCHALLVFYADGCATLYWWGNFGGCAEHDDAPWRSVPYHSFHLCAPRQWARFGALVADLTDRYGPTEEP